MASYTRKEVVTRRVIFSVPSPSPLDEVGKAIQAARTECAKKKGKDPNSLMGDDIMVRAYDDEVHVYYEEIET